MLAKKFLHARKKVARCREYFLFQALEQTFQTLEQTSQVLEQASRTLELAYRRRGQTLYPVDGFAESNCLNVRGKMKNDYLLDMDCADEIKRKTRYPRRLRLRDIVVAVDSYFDFMHGSFT